MIDPVSSPPPQATTSGGGAQVVVPTRDVASSLRTVRPGTKLDGVVLSTNPVTAATSGSSKAVVVETALGKLTLDVPQNLPQGTRLSLKVISNNADGLTVAVTAVNNRTIPASQIKQWTRIALDQISPSLGQATSSGTAASAVAQPTTAPAPLAVFAAIVLRGPPPGSQLALPGTRAAASTTPVAVPGATSGAAASASPALGASSATTPSPTSAAVLASATGPSGLASATAGVAPSGSQSLLGTISANLLTGAGGAPALPAGTVVQVRLQSTIPPLHTGQPAPAVARATLQLPTAPPPTMGGNAPAMPSGTTVPAPMAAGVTASSLGTTTVAAAPNPSAVPPAPLPAGALLPGLVVGTSAQGQTLVQSPVGLLALNLRQPLPPGTGVGLSVEAPPTLPSPQGLGAAFDGARSDPSRWPVMSQVLDAVAAASPQAAQYLTSNVIPRPDAALAVNVLFFLSALSGGNLGNWLGDRASQVLNRTSPDLLGRLQGEGRGKIATVRDAAGGDWRSLGIPFQGHGQGELGEIRLLLRDHHDADDEGRSGESERGTRFILDVTLSRIGRLQLDGLAKEADKTLALIVRTAETLDAGLRRGIHATFTKTCQGVGLTGQLVFQVTSSFVDSVGVDISARDQLGLIV